jgi:hypothetical protein
VGADLDTTGTTDPDSSSQSSTLADDQQTLEQQEQAEGQAAASGDYSTAQNDAQQAYEQSQTVANEGGPDNTNETWEAAQNESWANWDQQTADQDAATAASYANDTSGNPSDAADAQLYGDAAQSEQQTADGYGEAGEYGDPVGEPVDTPTASDEAPAEDSAPVDDTAAADTSAVDEDSSAS